MVLEEHPYGREMLMQLQKGGQLTVPVEVVESAELERGEMIIARAEELFLKKRNVFRT